MPALPCPAAGGHVPPHGGHQLQHRHGVAHRRPQPQHRHAGEAGGRGTGTQSRLGGIVATQGCGPGLARKRRSANGCMPTAPCAAYPRPCAPPQAITTLLKTGNESSIDRLLKQIGGFMSEIADEFKVVVVEAIKALCLKFPQVRCGCWWGVARLGSDGRVRGRGGVSPACALWGMGLLRTTARPLPHTVRRLVYRRSTAAS